MNFGIIKDFFSTILVESYLNETTKKVGKDSYKEFITELSNNDILRTQFVVYKNLENKNLNDDVSAIEYIKENISLFDKYEKTNILLENKKLFNKIKNTKVFDQNKLKINRLYESINNLIVLEKKAETIDILHESFEYVKENLLKNKTTNKTEKPKIDVDKFLNIVVEKYNNKYGIELSSDEKKVVKTILSEDVSEKQKLFTDLVSECVKIVSSLIKEEENNETKLKLYETKETLHNFVFNIETHKNDIIKLYQLKMELK
jgi:hypothetical protein